ncbi:hypothetical protein [Streptomyces sp. LMG1-1-1.1]|uniref:hypothetical protein n=1 Tax=Streptomyces sp. LMG1-1-1.1 TaxID=3135245 RepID=UPI0034678ACD
MHLPEASLERGGLRRLRGELGMDVDIGQRQGAPIAGRRGGMPGTGIGYREPGTRGRTGQGGRGVIMK